MRGDREISCSRGRRRAWKKDKLLTQPSPDPARPKGEDEPPVEEPATRKTKRTARTRTKAEEEEPMTIAGIIVVVCIILAILAFLLPRLSHGPQRGSTRR